MGSSRRGRVTRLEDTRRRRRGPKQRVRGKRDEPAPGSISERVRELTGGGSLRDEANRTPEVMFDPELRRRSRDLLRWIAKGGRR